MHIHVIHPSIYITTILDSNYLSLLLLSHPQINLTCTLSDLVLNMAEEMIVEDPPRYDRRYTHELMSNLRVDTLIRDMQPPTSIYRACLSIPITKLPWKVLHRFEGHISSECFNPSSPARGGVSVRAGTRRHCAKQNERRANPDIHKRGKLLRGSAMSP